MWSVALAWVRGQHRLIGDADQHWPRLDQVAAVLRLGGARELQRLAPRCPGISDRLAVGLEKLPDVVAAVSVAARASEQRPVKRLAHVVIVQVTILGIEASRMVLITRLAIQTGV